MPVASRTPLLSPNLTATWVTPPTESFSGVNEGKLTPSTEIVTEGLTEVDPSGYSQVMRTSMNSSSLWGSDEVSIELGLLTAKLSSLILKSRIAPLLLVAELKSVIKASPFPSSSSRRFIFISTRPAASGSPDNLYRSSPVSPALVSTITATCVVPASTSPPTPLIVITRSAVDPSTDVTVTVSVTRSP